MYEPIDPIDEMTLSEEEAEGDQEDYVDVQPPPLDQAEYTDVPSQLEVSCLCSIVSDSLTPLSHRTIFRKSMKTQLSSYLSLPPSPLPPPPPPALPPPTGQTHQLT